MADTDLFMECEEEELEPWQLIEDDVVDDTGGGMLLTASNNVNTGVKTGFSATSIADQNSEVGKKAMLTVLPSNNNTGGPLMNSGNQPLIVTPNPSGISSQMSMPSMYQPAAVQVLQDPKTGVTSSVSGQPILITTQGFTVKDLRSVQNPVGIVLNVQGGQGAAPYQTKPLTLVPAATQFVKSAVGVPQLWSPVTSIRPATNTFPGSVTTVIPAAVTIRSTVPPVTQKSAAQTSPTQSHLQPKCLTQPMSSPQQPQPHSHVQTPSQPRPQIHSHSQPNMLHHPHSLQLANHDHKLVNFLQNTSLIRVKTSESTTPEIRPKPEEVVKSSILPPVQITTTTTAAAHMMHKNTLNNTTPFKLPESNINNGVPIPKDCPKCNIHFNIMESLRVHMAYCCPQLLNSSTPTKSPQPHPAPPQPQPPPPPPPPTPPTSTQQPPVKLAEPSQGKLIMLVDDFYYGRDEGSTYQMLHEMKTSTTFRCLSCLKRLKNNIRFMNHMKHHLELEQQNDESIENHTTCQHCFRQYATPFQLQCHIENVHSPYETTTKCKICELAFETEQLFLQHMKDTHKPGEMPYVCQVCEYRSSVYLEVDSHFRMIHEDTKNLLCPYCLKVLKNSNAYQQHYMKHQKKIVYPCNKCRLQFISAKEKMEHKVDHHKTFKKPKQLEGLQPGTKVTIRTSMGQARAAGGPNQEVPARKVYPPVLIPKTQESPTCSTVHTVTSVAKPPLKLDKKKSVERMITLLVDMQEIRKVHGNQVCLECNFDITNINNISNHFPTYVHCSRCRYSTSCSRAYADHMISYHTQRGKPKYLMFGKMKKSGVLLACSSCTFTVDKGDGDEMAQHLDLNQEHGPCRFVTLTVNNQKKGSEMAEETAQDWESWLPTAEDESDEEEEKDDVQESSAVEKTEESSGPATSEVKGPVVKTQEVTTVRLSTVCSTNYINARVSSRSDVESSPPSPPPLPPPPSPPPTASSNDKSVLCAVPINQVTKPPTSPIYIEDDKKSLSPIIVEEKQESSSLVLLEERKNLSPISVEEERRNLSPVSVEENSNDLSPEHHQSNKDLSQKDVEPEIEQEDLPSNGRPLSEHELRVVLHALCCGMQAALEHYASSRSQVEQWLNECAQQLDLLNAASDTKPPLLCMEAEEQLVEWVLVQREQQLPLTEETFLQKLFGLLGPEDHQLAETCLWAVGFFLRHNLLAYAKVTVEHRLPKEMEGDVQTLLEFAQRQINMRDFPRRMIANMDEIPIFLDPESLHRPDGALGSLGLMGTGQPQFVVVFTILADGSLLPTMVFSRGGLPSWLKVPSDILLEVKTSGHSEDEILKLWLAKVWQRHVSTRHGRSVLVLDRFRGHLSDNFIDGLSRCNSLPLVIPRGCTSRIQPLDMCISQTFRNFLQKRWAEYLREAKCYRDVYGDVLQTLLNWVAEAVEFVGSNSGVVQQSFLLAGLLSAPGGQPSTQRHKVEVQEELVSFLQEQLELSGKLDESEEEAPTAPLDPRLLTKLFEADSDTESFYGFRENDLKDYEYRLPHIEDQRRGMGP
ncbi:pogo transposable element with ZNF domain isoform X4 [Hypanus sabinus]|uniref:pogo transposable element with ZNF domain isoform X4 n=1 Tax=Hypanus sabinus TaxID=79690 RepID=UPI0028C39691|nr:pogo transposable element with ZNF domain isoform X4 [Hypanus sabinus]